MGSIEDVLKYIATNEVRWVDLQFFDLRGSLQRVTVSSKSLSDSSFTRGIPAARPEEALGASGQGDLILMPDPDTIARLPWETSSVRLICNVAVAMTESPYLMDCRQAMDRLEGNLQAAGVKSASIAGEVEFYLFDTATTDRTTVSRGAGTLVDSREARWSPSTMAGFENGSFLSQPFDSMYPARTQISETLEESFGYTVSGHCHGRSGTAQQNLQLGALPAKTAADALATLKFVVRNLSNAVNAASTFMPYPMAGERGSQLTLSIGLAKSADANLFYDASDKYAQLSQQGRYFIGGVLEHIRALMLFTAPTVSSYRRLMADPRKVGWSKHAGDALVQVPFLLKNMKENHPIVFTGADPSVNPYLAYPALLAAGVDGIRNKTDPGDPSEEEPEGKKKKERAELPRSLLEAIEALESDTKFIKGVIPAELLGDYAELKLEEHRSAQKALTAWEMEKYFNV